MWQDATLNSFRAENASSHVLGGVIVAERLLEQLCTLEVRDKEGSKNKTGPGVRQQLGFRERSLQTML
jgi:hypothetical protein